MRWLLNSGLLSAAAIGSVISTPVIGPRQAPAAFPTNCASANAARYEYSAAPGWQVTKLKGSLSRPRGLAVDSLGQLIVVESGMGLSVHTFGPDGCINSSSVLVDNRGLNHGLVLSPDGKSLYASTMTQAFRWDYDAAARKVSGSPVVVVKGMNNGGHNTRSLYLAPGNPDVLLAAVGSNANWDYASTSMATPRAVIKGFDLTKVPEGGHDYATAGWQFGWGLRNEVGVAFDPDGMAWGVENSGDDFARTVDGVRTDIHNGNPAEELNYLGDPTKPNEKWYGYPTCFTIWDPSLVKDKEFSTGDQFVVTPNASFTDTTCKTVATPPRLSFQAHSAPITGVFNAEGTSLFVTFHGSWNRNPATGYKLVEVPFKKLEAAVEGGGRYDPVAPSDSMDGYNDIVFAKDVERCSGIGFGGGPCWRPAGLVWDPSGTRLIMSSDGSAEGELFLIGKA